MRRFEYAKEAREFFELHNGRPMSFRMFGDCDRWTAVKSPFLGETVIVPSYAVDARHIGTQSIANGKLIVTLDPHVWN